MFKRLIASLICITFSFSNLQYVHAQGFSINQLPVPGTMVGESVPFAPLALKGLIVNLQKPLEFQFIVDTGRGPQDTASVKDQANQLVKYFLAGLTIPEGDLWVNLSPYEKNRMVPQALGQTDLGRDLLAQDYILKQLTASLIYPEKDLGKEFWSRVYAKAQEQFGTTNVPVNTFHKVWILPNQAQVFENGNVAYVTKSTLKVMLDEDYLAKQKHQATQASSISSQIVRQIILPEIEKEVNTGKNFAPLRQIYQALILAKWYKETIQNGLLDAVYTNKNKVAGVNLNDPAVKEQIYNRYLQAYKKGAFNYIKEDPTPDGQVVPRKYFSGGTLMVIPLNKKGRQEDIKGPDGAMLSVVITLAVAAGALAAGYGLYRGLKKVISFKIEEVISQRFINMRLDERLDFLLRKIDPNLLSNQTRKEIVGKVQKLVSYGDRGNFGIYEWPKYFNKNIMYVFTTGNFGEIRAQKQSLEEVLLDEFSKQWETKPSLFLKSLLQFNESAYFFLVHAGNERILRVLKKIDDPESLGLLRKFFLQSNLTSYWSVVRFRETNILWDNFQNFLPDDETVKKRILFIKQWTTTSTQVHSALAQKANRYFNVVWSRYLQGIPFSFQVKEVGKIPQTLYHSYGSTRYTTNPEYPIIEESLISGNKVLAKEREAHGFQGEDLLRKDHAMLQIPKQTPDAAMFTLLRIKMMSDVNKITAYLNYADSGIRKAAMNRLDKLVSAPEKKLPILTNALGNSYPDIRIWAIQRLGELSDKRAVGPLIKYFKMIKKWFIEVDTRNITESKSVILSLGKLNDKRAIQPLTEIKNDVHEYWLRYIVAALYELGEQQYVQEVLGSLDSFAKEFSEDGRAYAIRLEKLLLERGVAKERIISIYLPYRYGGFGNFMIYADALIRLGDGNIVNILNGYLVNPSLSKTQEGFYAARKLAEIGDKRSFQPLVRAYERRYAVYQTGIQDSPSNIGDRKNAVKALGDLGDLRAIQIIEQRLQFPDFPEVIEAAQKALRKLRGFDDSAMLQTPKQVIKDAAMFGLKGIFLFNKGKRLEEKLKQYFTNIDYKTLESRWKNFERNYLYKLEPQVQVRLLISLYTCSGNVPYWALEALNGTNVTGYGEFESHKVRPLFENVNIEDMYDLLIDALSSSNRSAREDAAYKLGEISNKNAIEPLFQLLNDEDRRVRNTATIALGKLGDMRVVENLLSMVKMRAPNIDIRGDGRRAREALKKLGYKDSDFAMLQTPQKIQDAAMNAEELIKGMNEAERQKDYEEYNRISDLLHQMGHSEGDYIYRLAQSKTVNYEMLTDLELAMVPESMRDQSFYWGKERRYFINANTPLSSERREILERQANRIAKVLERRHRFALPISEGSKAYNDLLQLLTFYDADFVYNHINFISNKRGTHAAGVNALSVEFFWEWLNGLIKSDPNMADKVIGNLLEQDQAMSHTQPKQTPNQDAAMFTKFTVLKINMMSDVTKILTYLYDPDSDIRKATMDRIDKLAINSDLQYIAGIAGIRSSSIETVGWAAGILVKSGKKEAINPLLKVLGQSGPVNILINSALEKLGIDKEALFQENVKIMTSGSTVPMEWLVRSGRKEAAEPIGKFLRYSWEGTNGTNQEARKSLERLGVDKDTLLQLNLKALHSGGEMEAIIWLGESGRKEAIGPVAEYLDSSAEFRQLARKVLTKLGVDQEQLFHANLKVLSQELDNYTAGSHQEAIEWLGESGRKEAIGPIAGELSSINPGARQAARKALQKLGADQETLFQSNLKVLSAFDLDIGNYDYEKYQEAIEWFAQIKDVRAIQPIVEFLIRGIFVKETNKALDALKAGRDIVINANVTALDLLENKIKNNHHGDWNLSEGYNIVSDVLHKYGDRRGDYIYEALRHNETVYDDRAESGSYEVEVFDSWVKKKRDSAMNGGIDLNQIAIKRTGKTFKVEFDPAQLSALEQGGFEGFTPVITNITHISSPFQLLGINPTKEQVLAKV